MMMVMMTDDDQRDRLSMVMMICSYWCHVVEISVSILRHIIFTA